MNVFMAAILPTGDFISNRPPMAPWNQNGGVQARPEQFVIALKNRCNEDRRSLAAPTSGSTIQSMSMTNHRQSQRHAVRRRAILVIGDELHGGPVCAGDVLEISLGGGLFAPDPAVQLRPGLPCRLTLMNGRNPAYLSLAAVVAGTRQRHIALRFSDPVQAAGIHPGAPPGTTADVRSWAVALLTA